VVEQAMMSEEVLRSCHIEGIVEALYTGAGMLGCTVREVRFIGWGAQRAGGLSDVETWLCVRHRPHGTQVSRDWHGLTDACAIGREVRRPVFLRALDWVGKDCLYRVEEASLISQPVLSSRAHATVAFDLPATWWSDLQRFLAVLGDTRTNRVGLRQDLINRRIRERYGPDIDCVIDEWTTGHADLHWGNLSAPPLVFFDWEIWGRVPRGADAAMLLGYSLAVPTLAEKVREVFAADLQSKSGRIARLFTCSELLRMIERYNDHPELGPYLEQEAEHLLACF